MKSRYVYPIPKKKKYNIIMYVNNVGRINVGIHCTCFFSYFLKQVNRSIIRTKELFSVN